ncbi:hypothetical protein DSLASN_32210 [Desulfoluna limicola]|uniref:DUF6868 domain-containing protein n=1 Tax=Desulfoluna limicola TaxID=2810562 RepID=A0ABN6F5Y8_9BACT|nr:hypothetical protein [Desulfoluna limicola]BCS97589.1 hypothetical protein DSLASN_32210 [Desulfoluna limicola]
MTVDIVRDVLAWCAVMNYAALLVWFLIFSRAHDWMYILHSRWFSISEEQFDAIHYACMALYKVGIFLFVLSPYLALRLFV